MPDVFLEKKIVLDLIDVPKKPGLSSTSDMPVIETKPDVEVVKPKEVKAALPAGKPEGEAKQTSESATELTDEHPGEPARKESRGVQKKLDELMKQREDEKRDRLAAEARLDRALAALERPREVKPEIIEQPVGEPQKPVKDTFSDPEAYDAAIEQYIIDRSAWTVRNEIKAARDEDFRKSAEAQAAREQATVREAHALRTEKAKEKYSDFSEVAESPDVTISIPMAHTILHSEHGADIQYYLGKHPEEAKRITSLTVADQQGNAVPDVAAQLLELGLIVGKLNAPAAKPVSAASSPIKPIIAASETTKTPDEETMEEYATRRKKELQASMRPGVRH